MKNKRHMSKSSVIVLSLVLLTGLALAPALQIGVNSQVQQQQPSLQQNQVNLSQETIEEIAQAVSNANPGTNATGVQEILAQSAKQMAQVLQPSNSTLLSQISPFIQAITNNITSHNPDVDPEPDPDKIKQILQGIGMEIGEISETRAVQAMSEIAAEVDMDPKGVVAQALIALSQQTDNRAVIEQISTDTDSSIVDSVINCSYCPYSTSSRGS